MFKKPFKSSSESKLKKKDIKQFKVAKKGSCVFKTHPKKLQECLRNQFETFKQDSSKIDKVLFNVAEIATNEKEEETTINEIMMMKVLPRDSHP